MDGGSRDLDMAVSEHVYGWRWATFLGKSYLLHRNAWNDSVERPGLGWKAGKLGEAAEWNGGTGDTFGPWIRVPDYSSDYGAAMRLFEHAVELVGYGSISADMEDCRGEGFVVSVTLNRADGDGEVTVTDRFCAAVCRAAIFAVTGECPPAPADGAAAS